MACCSRRTRSPTWPLTLADLWLADLDMRDLAEATRESYQGCLRLHVRPAFEHYTLAEVTTGRVEWFLNNQARVSFAQAKLTRTPRRHCFSGIRIRGNTGVSRDSP